MRVIVGLMLAATILMAGVATTVRCQAPPATKSSDAYINIADQDIQFDDQSALTNEANLQSEQYSQFIHQLYHLDAENLQKFDNLYMQHQLVQQH